MRTKSRAVGAGGGPWLRVLRAWAAVLMLVVGRGAVGAEASVVLGATNGSGGVVVGWTSRSLTKTPPYVHYEYRLEHSGDLVNWEPGALVPGGLLGEAEIGRSLLVPGAALAGFVRVEYRLNLPGADLGGLDLGGADLRGANLAGANLAATRLTGAWLDGASLAGADLTGAHLDGASLQDADLTGAILAGTDLGGILGLPFLSRVPGDPSGAAAGLVPALPYHPAASDYATLEDQFPGWISRRHAMVLLTTNATVGQLNHLLAAHGATVVASSPGSRLLPGALLMLRLPAAGGRDLYERAMGLEAEPGVALAVPDLLVGQAEVTDTAGAAEGWRWDVAGQAAGGNWGLERGRVPQMWNLVSALESRGVGPVETVILDVDFRSHEDVVFAANPGPTPRGEDDHGIHVAGIAGALRGNGKGIDGVNPFIRMAAYTVAPVLEDRGRIDLGLALNGFDPRRMASGYRMIEDLRILLGADLPPRIINASLGFNWYLRTNRARPYFNSPFNLLDAAAIQAMSGRYGRVMAEVAAGGPDVLIVCAAGNDYRVVAAADASPMTSAALTHGAPNILVIEAHDRDGERAGFSNAGGHLAAPGVDILSAVVTNGLLYGPKSGTSMATPFVAGVAGFLMAVEPALDPPTVRALLQAGGPNIDAFASVLAIDALPGRDRSVLRLLSDLDDGSLDGSRRVLVPGAELGRDRAFVEVTGPDFDEDNHVVGDGAVDMSDFRRWRDWLLHGEGGHALNGSPLHLKHDGNGDFSVHPVNDRLVYPRGDLNGDGRIDRDRLHPVPGSLGGRALSDLDVLIEGGLWADAAYPEAAVLRSLVDSVDLHLSATNFYQWNRDIGGDTGVTAYDAFTHLPFAEHVAVILSPEAPEAVLTIPVGGKHYVGSRPLAAGGGTNVMMRSIGERVFPSGLRGADFAVDLVLAEMTAVADVRNPDLRVIDSVPNTNRVWATVGGLPGDPVAARTQGASASATSEATLEAVARATSLSMPPFHPSTNTVFRGGVLWRRGFVREPGLRDPRFLIRNLEMELVGTGAGQEELRAVTDVVLEMRAYDREGEWRPFFTNRIEIAGRQATGGQPATFRIVEQAGNIPARDLEWIGDLGVRCVARGERGIINLAGIPDGHSFELRLRLETRVEAGSGGDASALASLGDPLVAHSGFRMVYGSFGDLPLIQGVRIAPRPAANGPGDPAAGVSPSAAVEYFSKTNFYYRLHRGADADPLSQPIAMKLGVDGEDALIDPDPVRPDPTEEDYTVENQPLDRPLDFDADGLDDVYELRRPGVLDPLDPADAFRDSDGDGRSNREEYRDGTDPAVADEAASGPVLDFPGELVPGYAGWNLVDLNADGRDDAVDPLLNVSLALPGGEFGPVRASARPGMRTVADAIYVPLDGDAYPDAVLVDSLTNRVFAFRGLGDGTFLPLWNGPAITGPTRLASCDLDGNPWPDVAIFSPGARGVELHVNRGDGTLQRVGAVVTNAFGTGTAFLPADLNGDGRDDLLVAYASALAVFLSLPEGGHGPALPLAVGSAPSSIAVGDLDGDTRPDIVVGNAGSDDVSVLLASAPGVFRPQVRYPVGDNPRALRLARLRVDGPLDVVVTLSSGDYQVVLPGGEGGVFGPRYTVSSGTALTAIRDWNRDGRLDLVGVAGSAGGFVVLGNGDGTFDSRLQIVPTNAPPTQVLAVDLDGQAGPELVGLQGERNSIDVWTTALAADGPRLRASVPLGSVVTGFVPGDFNGDGLVDLAVTTRTNSFGGGGSNQVVVLTNAGSLVFVKSGQHGLGVRPNGVVAGDFSGDGRIDLAVHAGGGALNGGSQLVALVNGGPDGFSVGPATVVATSLSLVLPVEPGADGRSKLLLRGVRGTGAGFLEVHDMGETGLWTFRQGLTNLTGSGAVQVLEVNGDADPDVVMVGLDPGTGVRSLWMHPGGPGGFGPGQVIEAAVPFQSFVRLVDLDADGRWDVLGDGGYYLSKPAGGFHPLQAVYAGSTGVQGAADFDGDGKVDLYGGLSVLRQR